MHLNEFYSLILCFYLYFLCFAHDSEIIFLLAAGVVILNKCYFDIVLSLQVHEVQYRPNLKVYRFTIFNRLHHKVHLSAPEHWVFIGNIHQRRVCMTGAEVFLVSTVKLKWLSKGEGVGERKVPTSLSWDCSSERITGGGIYKRRLVFVLFILVFKR